MIPLHFDNSTVLAVPEPEKQHADIYLLEMPITQVIELDAEGIHLRPTMYLSDQYSTKNFTAIVPPNVFKQMRKFVSTRSDVQTKITFDYLFDCSEVEG